MKIIKTDIANLEDDVVMLYKLYTRQKRQNRDEA